MYGIFYVASCLDQIPWFKQLFVLPSQLNNNANYIQ